MDARRAPVVVGVGQVVPREPGTLDAVGVMVAAARAAGEDACAPALLGRAGVVVVPEGTWAPGDAGRAVAEAVDASAATTVLARIGILQTTPIGWAASEIAARRLDVALVVGGEARASERAGFERRPLPGGAADLEWAPEGEIVTAVEIERGLAVPVQSYAIQEEAIAHHRGASVLDELWAGFAEVAGRNPYAWDPNPASGDRLISTPYQRRHVSQWNVDMGVALLLCASEVADAAGVPDDRRVYPVAVVDSNAMVPVSRRAELHRSPAFGVIGERLAGLAGVEPAAAEHLDLYSCFPSAVQIQAAELGIDLRRELTVTGGMAFGGGPLNSAALHAMASMVDVLRQDPGSVGLVTAISGMITKQGASMWSTEPPVRGFAFDDVGEAALAATRTVDVDADLAGEVRVDGATVVHGREGPELAIVVGTSDDGRRAVATGAPDLARRCGDVVKVDGAAIVG